MGSQQRPVAGFNDDIGLETQSIPFADVFKLRRPRIPVDAKAFITGNTFCVYWLDSCLAFPMLSIPCWNQLMATLSL